MKAATVSEIKKELSNRSSKELLEFCLTLSKFKKENKELLTYLLYEAQDEEAYIRSVKMEIDQQFEEINTKSYYFIKKSVRKILRIAKKYIRYSKKKQTEVDVLLYFCEKLKEFRPSIKRNVALTNLYNRQLDAIHKIVAALHEDLQYDYQMELEELGRL